MLGSCSDNPQTWEFDLENKQDWAKHEKSIPGKIVSSESDGKSFRYVIQSWSQDRIVMSLVGEKRKTNQGEPVVWELWLVNDSSFVWHRLDWRETLYTRPLVKCDY